MKKIYIVIWILFFINILFSTSLEAQEREKREEIFERFKRAAQSVSESNNALDDKRVVDAIEFLLVRRDVERAKMLLYEAGWPSGFSITLPMSEFGGGESDIFWLGSQLKKVGVDLELIE